MSDLIIRPEIYFIEKRDANYVYYGLIIVPETRSQAIYSKPFAKLILAAFKNIFHLKEEILAVEDAIDNSRLALLTQQADIEAYYEHLDYLESLNELPQKLTMEKWLVYLRGMKIGNTYLDQGAQTEIYGMVEEY